MSNSVDSFISESNKLHESISHILKNPNNLQIDEIIGLYFQVINVSSLLNSMRENNEVEKISSTETLNRIQETEEYIDEKFNSTLHPLLIRQLEKTIEDVKDKLKNIKSKLNSSNKKEIENQAKMFEELRQLMSTREFLIQYNKSMKNHSNQQN